MKDLGIYEEDKLDKSEVIGKKRSKFTNFFQRLAREHSTVRSTYKT